MSRRQEVLVIIQDVLRRSGVPRTQIAKDAAISPSTLASWIAGIREPQPNSLRHLATGLERRAAILLELAEKVRQTAEQEG